MNIPFPHPHVPAFLIPFFAPSLLLLAAMLALAIIKRSITPIFKKIAARTTVEWDDMLVEHKALDRAAHLVPALLIAFGLPYVMDPLSSSFHLLARLNNVYFILVVYLIFDSVLDTAAAIYQSHPARQNMPVRGLVQAVKLLVFLICLVLMGAQLADRSPLILLSGLGALTAVLLLIFKDTLLGLVAGVQITTMDLVRTGDWIEMPKHNADGIVVDVSLATVRVRNGDRTITSIPTYELVSSSFKNWRGMTESGGRRIKRAVRVDINSIRFLDEAQLQYLRAIKLLRPYLESKVAEIEAYNASELTPSERATQVNGRHLTNVGTFRAYCLEYLKAHSAIRQDMPLLVRQLEPTPEGLPLELYAFVNATQAEAYEAVQADIYDHLLAVMPEFGLRIFQVPAGADVRPLPSP
jgi:miniconductance mechanosensitive channel